jgi:putative ABC transport system permease protein
VEKVEPGIYTWIAAEGMPFFLLFGYEPDSVAVEHYRIVAGKPLTGKRQIVLGRQAAESLRKGVDDTLRLYGAPYKIVGLYETGQGMEESGGLVTLEDAQEIAQRENKVTLFQVGLSRNADIEQVTQRIEATDKTFTVSTASEYDSAEQWGTYVRGFAWGIAGIAVLVGGLGMMNAMVMSVLERTREIGTLRSLGWTRQRVMRMILGEALILSIVGGLFGIALGIGLSELAARTPGVGVFLEGAYSPALFVEGMATALLLGLLGGAYPARWAANLQPVEALRYEGGSGADATSTHPRSQSLGASLGALRLPFRNLWRRRVRTIISVTGIGIGVATLVMLGGLSRGMMQELNSLAGSAGTGNLTLMQAKVADMSLSTLDERLVSQIRAMPGVKSVSPFLMGFVMTPEMPLFIIAGLDPNSSAMKHYKLVEGRNVARPNEIIVGKTAAKNYKLGIGDTVTLYDSRYKVVGIFETGVGYEDSGGMLALREAQRLLNLPRSVSFIFVDATTPAAAEPLRAALAQRFPEAQVSLSSSFAQGTGDMQNMNGMIAFISGLALVVGSVVVANTMLMSIYERTREIGTLRAVGWRKRRILSQVVQESLLLCTIAGLAGSVVGVLAMELVEQLPGLGSMLTTAWNWQIFARAMAMALFVGLIAGLYPAWRASRVPPVEALRYE